MPAGSVLPPLPGYDVCEPGAVMGATLVEEERESLCTPGFRAIGRPTRPSELCTLFIQRNEGRSPVIRYLMAHWCSPFGPNSEDV